MNQVSQIFLDSNRRMAKLMAAIEGAPKPDMDVVAAAHREAEIQMKGLNTISQFYAVASKNKRAMQGLSRMNIMDDTTAIDLMLGDPEVDKVKCPINGIIPRCDCLDFSGEQMDECDGCEIGKVTKRLLVPV